MKFQIGSKVFFGEYADYDSKDDDVLYVMEGWNMKQNVININRGGIDRFFIKDAPKQVLIQEALTDNIPMRVGKFLVPAFAEYLGMTIEDLKMLQPLIDSLDEEHSYEKLIYDAYIENEGFSLTEAQRDGAYGRYRESRKDTNTKK